MNFSISFKNQLVAIIFGLVIIHTLFGAIRENIPSEVLSSETLPEIKQEQTAKAKIPNGFANYTWGDPSSKMPKKIFFKKIDSDRTLYKMNKPTNIRANNLIGNSVPNIVFVMFTDNKLSYVTFQIPLDKMKSTVDYMTKQFGSPKTNASTLIWENDETIILVKKITKKFFTVQAIEKSYYEKY